jgi:hypothetical protein
VVEADVTPTTVATTDTREVLSALRIRSERAVSRELMLSYIAGRTQFDWRF